MGILRTKRFSLFFTARKFTGGKFIIQRVPLSTIHPLQQTRSEDIKGFQISNKDIYSIFLSDFS